MTEPPTFARVRDLVPAMATTVVVALVASRRSDDSNVVFAGLVLVGLGAIVVASALLDRFSPPLIPKSEHEHEAAPPPTVGGGVLTLGGSPQRDAARPSPPSARADLRPWTHPITRGLPAIPTTLSVAKLGNSEDENEDAYALDPHLGRLVVADGASSSFASRAWSRALCDEFVADAAATESSNGFVASVARAASRWSTALGTGEEIPWYAQQGMQRGAFATLVVVDIAEHGPVHRWRATAVGDSCFAQLRRVASGWTIVTSFPVAVGDTFGSHPHLLHTNNPGSLDGLTDTEGEAVDGDVLIVATDAVAEWLLADRNGEAVRLLAEASPQHLATIFTDLRTSQQMVNDDCTFIRAVVGRAALR